MSPAAHPARSAARDPSDFRWMFFARRVFPLAFVLSLIALVVILARYGIERQDRFEVFVISVDWLALIINGALLSLVFGRRRRDKNS